MSKTTRVASAMAICIREEAKTVGSWQIPASSAPLAAPGQGTVMGMYPRDRGMPTEEAVRSFGSPNIEGIVVIDSI